MEDEDDDNWLNRKEIECPNCRNELVICDHSPFENSYRLNCASCPIRVDIGNYDAIFNEVIKIDEIDYDAILLKLESLLLSCKCGGKFSLNASRRCLYCAEKLEVSEEQNVWPSDKLSEEEVDKMLSKYIVEPKWKKSR